MVPSGRGLPPSPSLRRNVPRGAVELLPFLALLLPQLLTDGKWVLVNQLTDGRWTMYLVPILHLSLFLISPGSQQLQGGGSLPKPGNVFVVWVPECPSPVL